MKEIDRGAVRLRQIGSGVMVVLEVGEDLPGVPGSCVLEQTTGQSLVFSQSDKG